MRRPQYRWGPLFQQPVFMQAELRKPQLVRHVGIDDRSRLFLQAAMHVFSSPLHRIGAAPAGRAQKRAIPTMKAANIRRAMRSESIKGIMSKYYGR